MVDSLKYIGILHASRMQRDEDGGGLICGDALRGGLRRGYIDKNRLKSHSFKSEVLEHPLLASMLDITAVAKSGWVSSTQKVI